MTQGDAVQATRLKLLFDLGCAFAERIDLDELIRLVIDKCREALDAEGASVLLRDAETDELYFPYVVADDEDTKQKLLRLRFPANQGIAGLVVQTGRAVRVDDAERDPRVYRAADRQTGTVTHTLLAAPLRTREQTIGVLQVTNHRDGTPFRDDDLAFLEALGGSVAVAIENAQLYAALKASEGRLRVQVGTLRRDLARHDAFQEIVGTSDSMRDVFRLMESAATAPVTVLIEGETGTGKELVARALHRASPRADGPFIAVNCAAIPESLLESELFGHRKGAFTGALQDRVGLFEAAKGGTIFLDEVGEMPLVMQAKLLRVLQEGEVVPLGDHRTRRVDARVISATNRDLLTEVELKTFREDLYYRLATFPIHLPPLRERKEDILPIASRMLSAIAARHGKDVRGFSEEAVAVLAQHPWPGNVRELQNEIERATALVPPGEPISLGQLSARLTRVVSPARPAGTAAVQQAPASSADTAPGPPPPISFGAGLPDSLREARELFEAAFIARVLQDCDGNATRAAQRIGISRASIQNKLRDYQIR
jgi:transcriptional regulator with GAF, ATPase, and Fis domain